MKELNHGHKCIFINPNTKSSWRDTQVQRYLYWVPALEATGIRSRRAYCCRHTYATNALSAGVNPAYVSRQLGHANTTLLFTVYSRWIDGADKGRERAKLEAAFSNTSGKANDK
jgi:integrase